ncbi:site-2 protease family protein [Prochlorothrix hollandica]|uniref:site-2 protease family protein n=1 Tax=Prochlorothrix hollandica TaxID=1223 RepID=UPI00333E99CA
MQSGWRFGTLRNIPLRIDPSWLYIVGLITVSDAVAFAPRYGLALGTLAGLAMALLLFGSVLLHELGHSVVAQSQGITVNSITLFFFGGVAAIERESRTPGGLFQVAIAGPAVSFLLCLLFGLLGLLLPLDSLGATLAVNLTRINLALTLFNLIPGLPLDGGQVLKAGIWQATGSRLQGNRWAATSGKILGALGIGLGLLLLLQTGDFGSIWLALIGGFIWRSADRYETINAIQEVLVELVAADAMNPADFWARAGNNTRLSLGRMLALPDEVTVRESLPLLDVVDQLDRERLRSLPVVSLSGSVSGTIDRGSILAIVAQRLMIAVTPTQVESARETGVFPPNLPLSAIVQTIK